jgi:hypothetical protein
MGLVDIADGAFALYTSGEWAVQYLTWVRELDWDEDGDQSAEEVVEAIGGDEWFITQV